MADGRHFENSFISISQPIIIRFRSIWYADVHLNSHHGLLTKICNFANSRWWTDAILKIVFWLLFWRHTGRSKRNLEQRWKITCRY